MRKFGVRALACSLAAALVMTGLATPSVARAEDILLIAPAPESVKTLYITADMVDCDGEIVISGESWDRIVVSKEAESKDIYFDQVNVKELVVESGSSSNIQLWEVKADTVTVKEPELSELSVKELSSLLADPATQHMAVDLFMKNMEKNAKTEKKAPSIVTMEDAQIGEVVAHGNVTLDLAQGEVENLVVKASEKQQRVNVTVKNYDGSVSYKGGDALNITTLKLVDSRVKALKVDESAANNYLNVNNKDSVAMKVEVAGNAQVSLNVPMGELAVTEAATAAQVSVLNAVDELNISANAAQIDVSPIANIASATVEGDDVKVTGSGYLAEVDITGKGAYVSTEGTKVEGENTYVKQEYVEKPYDSWSENFASADVNANLNQAMNGGKFTYNEEGYGVASSAKGWEGFSVTLDNKDNGSAASFVIKMKVKKLDGTATQVRMTTPPGCSASYMDVVDLNGQWQTITSNKISVPGGGTVNVMVAPTDNSHTLELAVDDVVVERYTEWTAPAARPVVTENKTLTFTNSALSDYKSYNVPVSYSADENGTLTLKTNKAYQAVVFTLPETLNAADYSKLKVYAAASTGEIAVKVWRVGEAGDNGNPATVNYSAISNPVIDLSGIYGDDIEKIEIAAMSGDSCTIVVSKLIFAASGGSGEFGDEDAPVIPEEPTTPDDGGTSGSGGEEAAPDEVENAFYLFQDKEFSATVGADNSAAILKNCYMDGSNFSGMLPPALKSDATFSAKFETMEGIVDVIDSLVFEVTFTEATSKDASTASYEPQVEVVVQGNGTDGAYTNSTYVNKWVGIGEATAEAPKSGKTTFYFANQKFDDATAESKTWADLALGQIAITAKNAAADSKISGTYSVKVVLKESTDSVSIDEVTDTTLTMGETLELSATASDAVVWSSKNETVATVDANGKVTALAAGNATIVATCGTVTDEVELVVENAFYLFLDKEFSATVGADNGAAILKDCYMDGSNFSAMLPPALKSDATFSAKFETMEGIVDIIDSLVFEVTFTEATSKDASTASYEPQVEVVVQGNGTDGAYTNSTYTNKWVGIGEATVEAPKSGKTTFYFANQKFDDATAESKAWVDLALGQIAITAKNAAADTKISGTYSVKVILNK